jgi:hypothetical protein
MNTGRMNTGRMNTGRMNTVDMSADHVSKADISAGAPGLAYAHRLWTTLWMTLGNPAENPGQPGGNVPATKVRPIATHRAAAVMPVRPQPAVHACSGRHQRRRGLSPTSTDPMTTTNFVISETSQPKQEDGT